MVTLYQDQNSRSKAAAVSVGVHLLLLLLLIFWKFSVPATVPLTDDGIEVNLGTDLDGFGDDQPMAVSDPTADKNIVKYQAASLQKAGMRDMMRSDDPDAPEVNETRDNNNNNSAAVPNTSRNPRNNRQTTDNRQQQTPRYVYPGGNGEGGNRYNSDAPGTNEGNTQGDGDRGVPGGTPGATNYEGSPGTGNGGISHSLTGRQISPSRFEAEFRNGGKVEVRVTVDKEGNIISKSVLKSPNAELSRIALSKLDQAKFSKSNVPEQIGIITIVFKARS